MVGNRLDPRNNIISNIPKLIELFVDFYGEGNRETITEKFNNLIVAGYFTPSNYGYILGDIKKEIANECLEDFKKETGITDEKKIDALFGYVSDFSYIPVVELMNNSRSEYLQKSLLDLIRKYSGEEIESLEDEKAKRVLEHFKVIIPYIERLKTNFDERYNKELKVYYDYYEKLKSIEKSIQNKYTYMLLEEFYDLLTENDKKLVDNRELDDNYYKLNCAGILTGKGENHFGEGYIEAFSKENEAILNDENERDFKKDSIKRDRMEYFKKMGINHEYNYEEYMNDERCQKLIPREELIEKIVSVKNKYNTVFTVESIESFPHHTAILEELSKHKLLCCTDFAKNVTNDITCISTNFEEIDGKLVQRPILFFSGNCTEDMYDCRVIHELNHLYELNTIGREGDKILSISGWDLVDSQIDNNINTAYADLTLDSKKRNYEMFNEIINEFIAQDICKRMHEMGMTLTTDISKAKNSSYTSYETLLGRFTRTFYEEFKDDILASRKTGDITPLLDKIGEENFEEFNDMLRDYADRFKGFAIYKLYDKLKSGVDDEDTRYYNACVEKTKGLYAKFRENRAKYEEEHNKSL